MDWKQVKLGAVVSLQRGYDLPEGDRIPGFVPIYGSAGITGYHSVARANGPGVTIGRSGASFGVVSYSPTDYWPHNASLFVTDFHGNDERFIYYFLKSIDFSNLNSGSAQPSLNRNYVYQLDVKISGYKIQRKIAAVLSAYDDLTENNTRRITILEEMARRLYREWFVHFRFPGHEDVEMVGVEGVGRVPQGWKITPIGKVIKTFGGGTPSTNKKEYWKGGDIAWYSPSDLTQASTMFMTASSRKINELGLEKSSAKLFPPGSVMMTSRATIGVTAINTTPACTNQGFITCIPNARVSAYQLYFWIAESMELITNHASGATFKEINKTNFRKLPILVADQDTDRQFREAVTPIGNLILNLQRKNENLRQTRDLLLPRLISGELDVSYISLPETLEVPDTQQLR